MFWQLTWQDALAVTVTLWAIWYLARRVVGVVRRDRVTGCGTCAGCGSSAKQPRAPHQAFVPVDAVSPVASQDSAGRIP